MITVWSVNSYVSRQKNVSVLLNEFFPVSETQTANVSLPQKKMLGFALLEYLKTEIGKITLCNELGFSELRVFGFVFTDKIRFWIK